MNLKASIYPLFILCLLASSHSGAIEWAGEENVARFATFNVSMGLVEKGELARRLERDDDPGLQKLAEILQRLRPDVILLNEFDYQADVPAAILLNRNYLSRPQNGQQAISYDYSFSAPVNTGIDSGLDLDLNGKKGEPADAWGYGAFPGQYGMLVLSRFPIEYDEARSFQNFLWQDMPGAIRPMDEDGETFYLEKTWLELRLSSKSHWDVPIMADGYSNFHFLVSHPTPPVFDGPEDRNGARNHDEIHFWGDYLNPKKNEYIYDDKGKRGGLERGSSFLIAGDLNADMMDGDARLGTIDRLLEHPSINKTCVPASRGAVEAAKQQGGENEHHYGDPAFDTADFNDQHSGNLRLDYLLTSTRTKILDCGVYWPASDEDGHELVGFSDHRLVWVDIQL